MRLDQNAILRAALTHNYTVTVNSCDNDESRTRHKSYEAAVKKAATERRKDARYGTINHITIERDGYVLRRA